MDPILAVIGFVTVAAITPGPNNFIVMAAATRGGFMGAFPAMAGVVVGSLGLLGLIWLGAGAAFNAVPPLRLALTVAGALYLAWLGAGLIRQAQGGADGNDTPGRVGRLPSTALGVAAFQLLNPKAWVLVVTATAAISGETQSLTNLATLAATLGVIFVLCLTLWASAGSVIAGWLGPPAARRWFDRAMGGLLLGSAALLVF